MEAAKLLFRRRHRLAHARQFQSVFGARVRRGRGPVTVFALPNGLEHARLGLSIGRRCGPAVVRNALKRRLREAFRLSQQELPAGLDFVVTCMPHEPRKPEEYRVILVACCQWLGKEWARRAAAGGGPERGGGEGP
jgi:ribonuclease P protein component